MIERESNRPLCIGFALAVLLHVMLLPIVMTANRWSKEQAWRGPQRMETILPPLPKLRLGRSSPRTSSVAWIAYDDFRELMAPQSVTEQPALQQQVDPLEDASIPLDPTPPGPQPQELADSSPATPGETALLSPPAAGGQTPPLQLPLQDGAIALADPSELVSQDQQPAPPSELQPQQEQSPTSPPAAAPVAANPTAAPKSDRESAPVKLTSQRVNVHPGSVLTADGLEIKTVRPRPGYLTELTSIPRNAMANLVFNKDGEVIKVTLQRSTGSPGWDGALETSLYRWRATGEKVEQMTRDFELDVGILFHATEEEEEEED